MKKTGKLVSGLATISMLFSSAVTTIHAVENNVATGTQKVVIVGDDWGPAVSKTIISFDRAIDSENLDATDFVVNETKETVDWSDLSRYDGTVERKVLDAYVSDAQGNEVTDASSNYVTLEMYISPSEGSPFVYDVPSGFNSWCNLYELDINLSDTADVTSEGAQLESVEVEATIDLNNASQRICPIADDFEQHTYVASNGDSYIYGEYTPAQDDKQNALVIWLHGAGEGQDSKLLNPHKQANDNYIDLLGNEVTALAGAEFQGLFGGAYVITPQAPTMWMDDGEGNYQYGNPGSCYTESLTELIKTYVENNDDIDPNRIIIGGCSNGGYMTMQMILANPDYFAAAYPICEAFYDENITDEQIQSLVDSGMGIWFTYAKTDTTVDFSKCTVPTYERLVAAGAKDVHMSSYDSVIDTTGRFVDENGNPYEYNGHWSWIYFDNNYNVDDNDPSLNEWKWLAAQVKVVEALPADPNETTTPSQDTNTAATSVKTGDTATPVVFAGLGLGAIYLAYLTLRKRA